MMGMGIHAGGSASQVKRVKATEAEALNSITQGPVVPASTTLDAAKKGCNRGWGDGWGDKNQPDERHPAK